MLRPTASLALSAAFCISLVSSAYATPVQLIVNGGFETGTFSGFTESTQAGSGGTFVVQSGTSAPDSGARTAGPYSGTYYAVSGQNGPGAYTLTQSFTIAANASSVIVSFDLFANSYGAGITTGALNYSTGNREFATADILTGTANAFSTASADVIRNLFVGGTTGGESPYVAYSYDLSSLIPGTYQIRFGQADNAGIFSLGVDNVSVLETLAAPPSATPEPAELWMAAPLLVAAGVMKRRMMNKKA